VKPAALVADAIQDVTRRGELVLDTFLGSGTTLIASERCGRGFRGLDIDPAYVDVAIDRWIANDRGHARTGRAESRCVSGVGPGRPPATSRFRKGESGNPRGAPNRGRAPRRLRLTL
jgi:DNA methylase